MVFKAAQLNNMVPNSVKLVHVPFGLVQGEDGKKIKSRAGDSVKLKELLNEAIRIAEENEGSRRLSVTTSSSNNNSNNNNNSDNSDNKDVDGGSDGRGVDSSSSSSGTGGSLSEELQRRARIIGLGDCAAVYTVW